jgi:outer membrane protein assembly factor BamD
MSQFPLKILAIIMLVCTVGCSSTPNEAVEDEGITPAETLYQTAQDQFEAGSYAKSAENFLEVERLHPYSKWATPAQIQGAYAYYKNEKFDDAVRTLERFIKLNPGSDQVPYAHYLIALSYYNQISDVGRDQKMTLNALDSLKTIVDKFPDTDYARDATLKIDLVEDHLAGKEMTVGRYYQQKREYIGAINRFKKVVDEYETTVQVEEALFRLVECYYALGIIPEAEKYAAVLGHNYPGGKWYESAYALLQPASAAE